MPRDIVKGQEAEDVASYVASVAGIGDPNVVQAPGDHARAAHADDRPTGGGAKGDPAAGKQVFASAGCGSCHTLADAGSTGQRRPQSRRGQARQGARRRARHKGQGRDAVVQGPARSDEQIDAVADVRVERRRASSPATGRSRPRRSRLRGACTMTCVTGTSKRSAGGLDDAVARARWTRPRGGSRSRSRRPGTSAAHPRAPAADRRRRSRPRALTPAAVRSSRLASEPRLRRVAGAVLVGEPRLELGVEGRADHEHVLCDAVGLPQRSPRAARAAHASRSRRR